MMEALLYIGLSQAFFAAFVVITKKPRFLPDTILAMWLALIATEMAVSLYMEIVHFSEAILNFSVLLLLTYMPLMYLYVKALVSEQPGLGRRELVHFLPVLIFFLWLLFLLKDEPIFYGTPQRHGFLVAVFRFVFASAFFLSIVGYGYQVLRAIREHQQKIQDTFSYHSESITLNWLKFVLVLFILSFTGLLAMGIFSDRNNYPFDPRFFTRIALTIFSFGVSYFGVRQPALFKSPSIDDSNGRVAHRQKTRYERSGLSEADAVDYVRKLQEYMIREKPYLNPELTIKDISDHLNISRHHITQILNERLQKNFYNYINDFRIQEVKARLKDPKYKHLTVLAIAYDSGFNSKSAFNSIFKKATGMTPSEYRQVRS